MFYMSIKWDAFAGGEKKSLNESNSKHGHKQIGCSTVAMKSVIFWHENKTLSWDQRWYKYNIKYLKIFNWMHLKANAYPWLRNKQKHKNHLHNVFSRLFGKNEIILHNLLKININYLYNCSDELQIRCYPFYCSWSNDLSAVWLKWALKYSLKIRMPFIVS